MSTDSKLSNPGSSSVKPDLDWSQIKETISMLCLAMAQIEVTLRDSSRSVDQLSSTFTTIAQDAKRIDQLCTSSQNADDWKQKSDQIQKSAHTMNEQMQKAIVAFQFYDRLTQKLSHVNLSLTHLGELISDAQRLYNPTEWKRIQEEIRSNYTMECERLMFDHIMRGVTLSEALELYRHQFEQTEVLDAQSSPDDDDIELF